MGTVRETTDEIEVSVAPDDVGVESSALATSSVPAPSYVTWGHEALFRGDDAASRCDVCGRAVTEDDGEGPAVPGRALYVWARGDDVRREEPPLCPSCAAALGLSALGRWEIEEEEG